MASTDSTTFPVKGQAFRIYGVIKSSATGNPITGGLTTLTATISKDGAAFASPAGSIAEVGTTGYFYVDLTSVDMTANCVMLHVTAANANAVYASVIVNPIDLDVTAGNAMDHAVKKPEQLIVQTHQYTNNRVDMGQTSGTVYDHSGTAARTCTVSDDGTTLARGKLS